MALEQFLTGSNLPWLQQKGTDPNEDVRTGASLATSFMENSMRQQEMQQKALTNPIALKLLQDEETVKRQQVATGVFLSDERAKKEVAKSESAAWISQNSDLPYPQYADKFNKEVVGNPKIGDNAFNDLTVPVLQEKENAWKLKNDFTAKLDALTVKQENAALKAQVDLLKIQNTNPKPSADEAYVGMEDKALADIDAAKKSGDPVAISLAERHYQSVLNSKGMESTEVTMPDGTKVKIGKGPSGTLGTQTPAATTQVEEAQNMGLPYLNELQSLKQNLTAGNVGVRGLIGDLSNRYLAQLPGFSGLNNDQLTQVRTQMQTAIANARAISMDPRYSAQQRKDAAAALPSLGAGETLQHAVKMIDTVQGIIKSKIHDQAVNSGLPIPPAVMTPEEVASDMRNIKEQFQMGKITREKAIEIMRQRHPATVE